MKWEQKLKQNICTVEQLDKYAKLSLSEKMNIQNSINRHPMSITNYYASLIDWGNPNDPLRKMSVPDAHELNLAGVYDTSGEFENTKMPGLQHKYSQTALVLATNRCALYCRYCFRKRLVGLPTKEVVEKFDDAAEYISCHKEINNVLISGGDPFILPTFVLERFLKKLGCIAHLNFIRIGTKIPVAFPDRILDDKSLLRLLKKYSLKNRRIYIVTQFNHPREITKKSIEAVNRLLDSGLILNNQSALLKGVNDMPHTLAELQNTLVKIGVNPYYVFQCRPVKRVKYRFQDTLYRGYYAIEAAKRMLNGHSKRFKYVMSHRSGKIEIVGITHKRIYFKYHQAKDPKKIGKFFSRKLDKSAGWLD